MDPICNLCKAIMAEENEKVWKMLKGVGVDDKIKGEDRNLNGKVRTQREASAVRQCLWGTCGPVEGLA